MAVYKVPQDVEADDKLIGPFNFRQFIYLIIVTLASMISWGLARLFIPLAVIPLPFIIFFGALALPLRKDQPMEIYMAAILSFYLKSRRRLWEPDGIESLIEITSPKITEFELTKNISETEAERRFSYLAQIVDSKGWAVRGSGVQAPNSAMKSDVYFEAQQVQDVLDDDNIVARSLNYKLDQNDLRKHQEMVNFVKNKSANLEPMPDLSKTNIFTLAEPTSQHIKYNPYPYEIRQSVIQPINPYEQVHNQPPSTSEKTIAPGIINLASNNDLSIAAIAREANRIQQKQNLSEEVIVSLR
jgi:hypothetical protein